MALYITAILSDGIFYHPAEGCFLKRQKILYDKITYVKLQFIVYFRQACVARNILTDRVRLGTDLGTGIGPEA